MEYDVEELVSGLDFDSNTFVHVSKDISLTKREVEVLNRYKINYQNCRNLKEVIFMIEDVLEDMDIVDDDLDFVSQSISERDYYQNTNK